MAEPRFIHLRVHSDYSMIDGLAKTGPLVKKVAAMGMPAFAITDFTNLCGLVKFYGAAHGAGIKPIIGADFFVESEQLGDEIAHLTVLARNNEGYQNLTLLISEAYQKGYGAIGPTIHRDWLVKHKEGLILLSGGRQGDVGQFLLRGNQALVDECLAFYETHFPGCYYLELIRTGRPDEESYLHAAVELATQRGLPVVATNDVRFIESSDFDAHEIRVAIHDGFTLSDPKRPKNIALSNIYDLKKRCVSCLPTSLKHLKIV
ncbi:DNA polymerase III subunit alpha [Providencia stuartii MRSN 2154]|uniref:DNA polymerase III subunit alpha n=1 Tax=Providencia stuartii (strain MRSN 2154) TaxID=1157951 RepID=A0A140NM45_PROSM|nr:DNA polymerase III subunit alpha [Providencia stuartii MRSN 2154]